MQVRAEEVNKQGGSESNFNYINRSKRLVNYIKQAY